MGRREVLRVLESTADWCPETLQLLLQFSGGVRMCHARRNVQSFLLSVDFLQILPSFSVTSSLILGELAALPADIQGVPELDVNKIVTYGTTRKTDLLIQRTGCSA